MPRLCKWCNKPYVGRADKVFCSIKCKSDYHYDLKNKTYRASKQIDNILHRNRSILYEIMGDRTRKMKVKRTVLDKKKFNYKYNTGHHINKENKMYHNVYDFAWMNFSDGEVLIIRRNT